MVYLYTLGLIAIFGLLFWVAFKLVDSVYSSGGRINGILVGFISFALLIGAVILTHNRVILAAAQVVFLFGGIVFFMASTRNYKMIMAGEGSGWLARRVRRLQRASKGHSR
ncbi:hypothetical protein [Lacticaseibacillus hegangensis]|uniref:Uncharacterized protein n=1 Tax=Lacticaseibacillus hegangensis TaxID=2486010 RepID=A0ABW4CYP2_9LACO|nr:hypothetical protein [Lacticaseibacillus hegangensis]